MKKLIIAIVCLMTMISANAQDDIIRSVDGVSKERFFNSYGSDFEELFTKAYKQRHFQDYKKGWVYYSVKYRKIKEVAVRKFKRNLISPSQFVLSNVYGDRIKVDDLDLTPYDKNHWKVYVTGDARNRVGGYEHVNGFVEVCGTVENPY